MGSERGEDEAREVAASHGRLLVEDLLQLARERNPDLEIWLGDHFVESGGLVGHVRVLYVKTGRGTVEHGRRGTDRWFDVFRRAGLV